MIDIIDKTGSENGTPINRATLMAMQGFVAKTTKILDDGSILETNSMGETMTTTFQEDGTIVERFVGKKTITKITYFEQDGTIKEVIS